MSTVGYATLDVIPSVKGLAGELQKQTAGDLSRAGKVGGKRYGDAAGTEAAGGFKSRFAGAMKGFAPLAGLVGGASIVAGFKAAVGGASDLSESTSKVNVVFGDASASVLAFADNAAKGLGQSEAQALEATGTFGNLLRSVGLAEDVSAEFSTTMVGLASDLASFNNTSATEALDALRSGLVGETEPLKRFGVNMNEAVLKAKALELGLSDGKAVLDSNAKAQAAYAVIMEQTSLAQGDFARTSGGLANQSKILGAQWTELTTTAGQKLLPAVTGLVSYMNDEGIPALADAGGVAKDLGGAFLDLPAPIKGATAAFVALRIAAATGLTATVASAAASTASAMVGLRLRVMLAGDAYRSAGLMARTFAGSTVMVASGASRATMALAGLRAGALGAGAAMKAGLGGAVGLLGGPWGIAIIAAIGLLSKFWSEQQKAKAEVEKFTATLDTNTAALTVNTRETAKAALEAAGAFKAAQTLGISLTDVTDAALGNEDAIARVRERYAELNATDINTEQQEAMGVLGAAVRDTTTAIDGAQASQQRMIAAGKGAADATNDSADATAAATVELVTYAGAIDKARDKLVTLIEKEKDRALTQIQNRRDALALRETLKAARDAAEEGTKTLNKNTGAGRENMAALLDLADQWANSTPKVTDARGAYVKMRNEFITVATQMGATKAEAKKLADELLKVPERAPLEFQSKGYQKTMAEIAAIKAAAAQLGSASVDFTPRGFGTPDGRPSAPSAPTPTPAADETPRAGVVFDQRGSTIVAHDYNDFVRQSGRKAQQAGLGGRP